MNFFSRSLAQLRQYRKNIRGNGEWNNLQGMVRCTKWGACQDNKWGKRVCGSSWCLIGVCATSPNSQISHREVWDHHCKPSAWGKKILENRVLQKRKTNPESKNQPICDCFSLEESLQGNPHSFVLPYRLWQSLPPAPCFAMLKLLCKYSSHWDTADNWCWWKNLESAKEHF